MAHSSNEDRQAFENAVYYMGPYEVYESAGRLWNCTDVMPSSLCDELVLQSGATYAQGARAARQHARLWLGRETASEEQR